jgi:uncharacterized protein (DUF305 family)
MENASLLSFRFFVHLNKVTRLLFLAGGLLLMAGCDEEDEGLKTQPHDQNKMMQIMHAMMDQMEEVAMTGDPDVVFASLMIVHHQGAITMSNEELQSGDDATLKVMAQKIITDQQKEIQELQAFLTTYQPDQGNDDEFHMEMMASMEKSGQAADLRVLTGDTDHDFAELMIVHHQSAIENARSVMEHGTSPEIKEMAHMMINKQMEEIKQLQEWLLAHKQY